MAVGLIGVLDLSIVTDRLIALIDDAVANTALWGGTAPFTLSVNGSAPESVRADGDGGCQLSVYLFHVARDPSQANVPLNGLFQPQNGIPPNGVPQQVFEAPFFPLGLDLYYLLTAYADTSYVYEQQAMSVAMACLQANPIVTTTVSLDGQNLVEEFSVTLEVQSEDELSRLWQSTTAAMRLGAVYKVSPVFLTPQGSEADAAPPMERIVLTADPVNLPLDPLGDLSGTTLASSYLLPDATTRPYDLAPAVASAGDTIELHGTGLDQPTATRVYLVPSSGPRVEVTAWRTDSPPSKSNARIELPNGSGPAPAGTPDPGVYQLGVGSDMGLGDSATHNSRLTPFSIAARVDPGGSSLLTQNGGIFSFTGLSFITGHTEVLLGTVDLTEGGGPPTQGTFAIGGGGTTIDFAAPTNLASGRYAVRVRVNGIESKPTWWVDV
jgi:uncharacterized protein DUF4255